jgi:hypothetical protein
MGQQAAGLGMEEWAKAAGRPAGWLDHDQQPARFIQFLGTE